LEKRAEQVQPGSEGEWGMRDGVCGREKIWLKHCMHIGINE
jgi:hypothetical protein